MNSHSFLVILSLYLFYQTNCFSEWWENSKVNLKKLRIYNGGRIN